VTEYMWNENAGAVEADFVLANCNSPRELRFAYLNMRDHPRGQLMLDRLIGAGFVPDLVIDEDSPLATEGRSAQLKELSQVARFAPLKETRALCEERHITYRTTANHNSEEIERALSDGAYDLAVLGDTRILRPPILRCVRRGILNVHPGFLPDVRGNNPYVWSIIHGLPQGATVHLINEGVDRGPILMRRQLKVAPSMAYPDLIFEINNLCADILLDVMNQIVQRRAHLIPQQADGRLTFREASPDIKYIAAEMLRRRSHAAIRNTAIAAE
jgi:methionyl-tRNA formyltransferase